MDTQAFSRSKYKDGERLGDDVFLNIPGAVTGVFDGASDPMGTIIDGEPAGRFAARIVAQTTAGSMLDPDARRWSVERILGTLSDGLAGGIGSQNLPVRPSTTLALVLDNGPEFRLLIMGDTGVRVNGGAVHKFSKSIDNVSTCARVAVFNLLAARHPETDAAEKLTRRVIFRGLEAAVKEGVLTHAEVGEIITSTVDETALQPRAAAIQEFLMAGIRVQHQYANDPAHPFGFSSMDGHMPLLDDVIDFTLPKEGLQSLELFTDGYYTTPQGTDVAAWEQEHARIESLDFHKLNEFASVKGSTQGEYWDDRTVVIMRSVKD